MSLKPLIVQAVEKGLLEFDEDLKTVKYTKQNKRLR